MRFFSSRRCGRSPVLTLPFIAVALLAGGCSEQGAASQENAPLKIETSQMYVTVRNESGMPVNEVTVAIVPVGRATVYSRFIGRLENAESRNLMLGDFTGRDGTPFSLRVVKPRSVELKGRDIKGQTYNIEVPWQ
jgi:hypothetical protein